MEHETQSQVRTQGEKRTLVVGKASDLAPGEHILVPVGEHGVGVFNVNGTYHALFNYCPHRGAPLCRGKVTGTVTPGDGPYEVQWEREGEILRCPWHGWEFEIQSGRSCAFPNRRVRSFRVTVEDGMLLLHGVSA